MNDEEAFAGLVVWVIINLVIGYGLGKFRGQTWRAMLVCVVLGPLGWIGVFGLPDLRPKCPECRGVIVEGARRCKNCGAAIGGARASSSAAVNVKCPECGETGYVNEATEETKVVCANCHAKFDALGNQAFC